MGENQEQFSAIEIDTLGEIMNISMGSAATAASTLLDNQVIISTPNVKVVPVSEFDLAQYKQSVAVDIQYVEGLSGSNILILHKDDVRKMLGTMMMTELAPDFEIDEMAESAVCELMNQMMGSSATVLSCFLGRNINISTPNVVPIDQLQKFKEQHYAGMDYIVTAEFSLSVKGLIESRFVSAMDIGLVKEIIDTALGFGSDEETEEDAETAPEQPPAAEPAPPPPAIEPAYPTPAPAPEMPAQQYPQSPYPQQQTYTAKPPYPQQPYYPPQQYYYPTAAYAQPAAPEGIKNIDLVYGIPVNVTVELGRTKRKIRDILDFSKDAIVELDKAAAAPVDILVNGQIAAHGDLVVVDDNFSVRVTEVFRIVNPFSDEREV